VSKPWKKQ